MHDLDDLKRISEDRNDPALASAVRMLEDDSRRIAKLKSEVVWAESRLTDQVRLCDEIAEYIGTKDIHEAVMRLRSVFHEPVPIDPQWTTVVFPASYQSLHLLWGHQLRTYREKIDGEWKWSWGVFRYDERIAVGQGFACQTTARDAGTLYSWRIVQGCLKALGGIEQVYHGDQETSVSVAEDAQTATVAG